MADAKRRLAVILSADVAGYSRLMGDDERATMDTLNAYRDVFRRHISDRDGRVVDTAGDSVLALFNSIVEAVQCAVDVQGELEACNAGLPENRRMRFRVGVTLGDIFEQDDGTIYGNGVNVAARLESLAEPGGIWLSGSAHEQVEGKTNHSFEDVGTHPVKNIARPVRAFRVMGRETSDVPAPEKPHTSRSRPSIAVLPFDNLSGDTEQEYFADGMAEDLITALSRIRWLFVTARNSTFAYKGQAVDVKRVGQEMGVQYVLEGSVRKDGDRVRITAQLIEATTGNHIWAKRYDRKLADIFAIQDELTEAIVGEIEPELAEVERERAYREPPESLNAWDFIAAALAPDEPSEINSWREHYYRIRRQLVGATLFFWVAVAVANAMLLEPFGPRGIVPYASFVVILAPALVTKNARVQGGVAIVYLVFVLAAIVLNPRLR